MVPLCTAIQARCKACMKIGCRQGCATLQSVSTHALWACGCSPQGVSQGRVPVHAFDGCSVQGNTAVFEDCLVIMHHCPVCCRASSTVCTEATGMFAGPTAAAAQVHPWAMPADLPRSARMVGQPEPTSWPVESRSF